MNVTNNDHQAAKDDIDDIVSRKNLEKLRSAEDTFRVRNNGLTLF